MNITVKNVPDPVYRVIKREAKRNGRSLNSEIIRTLPAEAGDGHLRVSFWDAVYLALALEHDCAVLTADERLFRAGSGRHPSLLLVQ